MRSKRKTIYELGPSFRTQGGISSVLNTYYLHYAGLMNMKFVSTYSGKNRIMDLLFFSCALLRVFFICVFEEEPVFHIHSSTYGSYFRKSILAEICLLFRHKVVFHTHGSDFDEFIEEASEWGKRRITKFLNRVDFVVVLSESWRSFFSKYVSKSKIKVIYNPIQEVLDDYHVKNNSQVRILLMGRLGIRKGAYDLVEAIRHLDNADFLLELYGDGENEKIKALIDKYNLQHIIKVHNWVPHDRVIQIYDCSDILVLPSYSEGLPMSVIEAMGRGLPVITSDVGGIPEAVKDGDNGFIVKPGDVERLAERLKRLSEDGLLREKMGRRSLEIAKEKFSLEKIGFELEKLFSSID